MCSAGRPRQRREASPGPHDPRKPAVGLTFVVPLDAAITAQGEAEDFGWFHIDDLPGMGFGQEAVVADLRPVILQRTGAVD